MEPLTDVPNLPHFKVNKPKTRGKGGDFTYSGGLYFFEQVPQQQVLLDLHHKAASTSLQIRRGKEPSGESALLGASTSVPTAGYIANSGLVLKFEAYFKESVDESPLENHRVRKCRILLHLEDSSMKIDEYRQQNSGMLQGTLVKRNRIPYPEGKPGHYNVGDIIVGGTIDVYGRRFHVIDADRATRRFLKERLGRVEAPAIPFPTDRFTVQRKEFMSRETGCDSTVRHGIVKNEMKAYAEALLGNTVDNSKRAGFIKYDRNVLCFQAVWDDRGSLYGDIQRFELHYFLEDDTIEIRSLRRPNSGRDSFPVMLRRGKIPKSFSAGDTGEVYHWKDFGIGVEVNVYERPLVLVDADAHTRQFYASSGIRLGSPILSEPTSEPEPEPEPEPPLLPPSVDSFTGSVDDEDVAPRSTSLVPSPPRKIRGEDVMFRYTADLVSDILEDKGREFIITYYKEDRTITVREPPRKNSGVVGGNFLSRMKVRDVSGDVITEGCFYIGAEVTINRHLFRITGADDKTFRLMEERSANAFAFSDPVRAAEVISRWMDGRAGDLRTLLRERDTKGTGEVSRATLRDALESFGVRFSPTTPEQALITIMRAVGGDASSAPYESVVDRLEDPDGFQHGL